MDTDNIEAMIEEIERTPNEPQYYIQVYWQEGADQDSLASLIQKNWSSPSEPCSPERAMEIVVGLYEHRSDAAMLSTSSQKEAEQLVRQAVSLGAVAVLDDQN